MVKRKNSTNGETKTKKKAKKVSDNTGKVDCSSPENILASLISPIKLNEFNKTYWEKKHLHIKRDDSEFYGNLFSLEAVREIIDENELEFETDVNVCRYVNDEKEYLNEEGQITIKKFDELMKKKKATFQFHQPQRFSRALWQLMGSLETYFSSLVGANVYITPPESQGLAPHCDDVEIFVLQLEGKKTWKLYEPKVKLSRDYTQDLPQDDIGDPLTEITMEPGDLLYFPRGTIHQAKTGSDGHSTHISISTYQQNTWGDFLQHTISQAIDNAMEDDVKFREGLPKDYMNFLGTGKNMSKYIDEGNDQKSEKISNESDKRVIDFKEKVKMLFGKLVDHIDINTASDAMCEDFVRSRLPPFGYEIVEDEEEDNKIPTLNDQIKIRYPDHLRVVFLDEDEDDEAGDLSQSSESEEDSDSDKDVKPKKNGKKNQQKNKLKPKSEGDTEDDEDDEDVDPTEKGGPHLRVIHSLSNNREAHMVGMDMSAFGDDIKLPVHFGSALTQLTTAKDFVTVKDIALDDDDDKLSLVIALFADNLIEIKS